MCHDHRQAANDMCVHLIALFFNGTRNQTILSESSGREMGLGSPSHRLDHLRFGSVPFRPVPSLPFSRDSFPHSLDDWWETNAEIMGLRKTNKELTKWVAPHRRPV